MELVDAQTLFARDGEKDLRVKSIRPKDALIDIAIASFLYEKGYVVLNEGIEKNASYPPIGQKASFERKNRKLFFVAHRREEQNFADVVDVAKHHAKTIDA